MRRTVGIILVSFSLLGLWNQLWRTLGLSPPGHHQITPSCSGGSGDPDGSCSPH